MSQYLPIIVLWVTTFLLGAIFSLKKPRTHKNSRDQGPFISRGIIKPIQHYTSKSEYLIPNSDRLKDHTGLALSPGRKMHGQSSCQFFQKLPPEIRRLIYRQLLIAKPDGRIEITPWFMKRYRSSVVIAPPRDQDDQLMDLDIDASILRTCWTSYQEAVAILYSQNTFCFTDPSVIRCFQSEGLTEVQPWGTTPPNYNYGFASGGVFQGRFSMVRKLTIRLADQYRLSRDPNIFLESDHVRPRDFKELWSEFLLDFNYSSTDPVLFPALEELNMDFSDWFLGGNDRLQVDPIIRKFRGSTSLRKLRITNLKNKLTRLRLKEGLLAENGTFEAMEWRKIDNRWRYFKLVSN